MDVRLVVSCIPYATFSKEKPDNIITFAQFKKGDLLSETCNNTEGVNKYDDNSTLVPLISEEEMNAISSSEESDAESMFTYMLEDIRDGIQYHPSINRIEARYKIRDCFKQRQAEWKGALLSTGNMCKVLHKVFKDVVNEISQVLQILVKLGSEVSYFIPKHRNFAQVNRLSEGIKKTGLKVNSKGD